MKIPAVHSAAQYMGLPIRKKSRSRERKTVAASTRTSFRKGAAKSPMRSRRPVATTQHAPTFVELLNAAPVETRALKHQPPSPSRRVEAPQARSRLTPAAQRIIALGAEARGESLAPDGIEAQLKRERDKACGIDPVARAIIDRAESRA